MKGEGKAGDNSTIVQAGVGGGPQGQETGPLPLLRGSVLAQAQPRKLVEGWGETGAGSRKEWGNLCPGGVSPVAIVHLRDFSSSQHQLPNSFFPGFQSLQGIATQREKEKNFWWFM